MVSADVWYQFIDESVNELLLVPFIVQTLNVVILNWFKIFVIAQSHANILINYSTECFPWDCLRLQ